MLPSLEYLLCIAKHGNITRAAEELHVTQQSLSSYLKRLEEYYELPLFTRKPALTLTPFGHSVLDRAKMIHDIHEEIDSVRDYYQGMDAVQVGFSIIHIYQAMDLIDVHRFRATHRDVILRFRHNNLQTLSQMLGNRELDLYFCSYLHTPSYPTADMRPVPDLVTKEVGKFRFKVIIHPELVRDCFGRESEALIEKWRTGVELRELSCVPFILLKQIRIPVYAYSKENGYTIHLVAESDNVHLAMEMVAERFGFAVIPNLSEALHQNFLQFPVFEPERLRSQSILCCTTETALQRQAVRDLWNELRTQA